MALTGVDAQNTIKC